MADTEMHSQTPDPDVASPSPSGRRGTRALDLLALTFLLGVCATVYALVKDPGFSVIIGATAGLFTTWRTRQ
ncbi:hypothetical protein E0500_030225 [Streptomyces sp. KM273126]|uniref:hypothetical protein n=1 Tax=Streptomyces sp. KM273126 TaxID=2545247 RepID=UPI00103DF417|nr:hypothetical protein [Streptomyces sp. KM273126]MBA2811498.1 hypothetical protein [Streptomyces sp. KM273126]